MKEATASKSKLGARWQLNASMLSRPADLSALVTLSQSKPEEFFVDDTLHVLVSKLLNCRNEQVSDKDTKLDVLAILANLSGSGDARAKEEVRTALQGVSEWFDDYLAGEQGDGLEQEPELHKSMLLLLARAWNYKLKTEDLLELTRGDRGLALDSVVGVLEDGRTYATELVQSRKPGEGAVAQWEHELICRQHEKPLVLQLCRLVRGFTHPASYFAGDGNPSSSKNRRHSRGTNGGNRQDLALFSVDEFSAEMDSLLEITLRSRVIEKLSVALDACLFSTQYVQEACPGMNEDGTAKEENHWDGDRSLDSIARDDGNGGCGKHEKSRVPLEDSDHLAVHSVHIFMQNLYHYATQNTDFYRQHMLSDTLLVPRLVLPYLDQCVRQARLLCHRRGPSKNSQSANGWVDEGTSAIGQEEGEDDCRRRKAGVEAALAQGIASSLRTLVIASFRAPPNKFVLGLMQRLNPTGSLLRARPFVARHDYIFTLLCLLNVNMGALNNGALFVENRESMRVTEEDRATSTSVIGETAMDFSLEMVLAQGLMDDMAGVFQEMSPEAKRRVVQRVTKSGALPVSRDAPGYSTVLKVLGVTDSSLNCGEQGANSTGNIGRAESKSCREGEDWASDRKSAKNEAEARARKLSRASMAGAGSADNIEAERKAAGNGTTFVPPERDHKLQKHHEEDRQSGHSVGKTSRGEAKVDKAAVSGHGGQGEDKGVGRGLASLGDLPSLGRRIDPGTLADLKQQRVRVNLDLPRNAMSSRLKAACDTSHVDGSMTARLSRGHNDGRVDGNGWAGGESWSGGSGDEGARDGVGPKRGRKERSGSRREGNGAGGMPKEFLCAINGHMMKLPVRSPHGHVFELSTILLWLESRGRVCPFSGKPLSKEELVPEEELRTRIMRWRIEKTDVGINRRGLEDDDIYDF
ncbi:unnamed protein product [Ectocarpus sp. 4 AP-2014]